ncbi:MAG: L,D-transpeptidase [Peptoniphilus sp.]|nr:L,D-transpeptidase [Peptoniphilus sp.]
MFINNRFCQKCLSVLLIVFSIAGLFGNIISLGEEKSDWFESYDITDTEKMWEMIIRPITVLDAPEKTKIYLLDAPKGKKVKKDKLGGYINAAQAGVKVLGKDEDGYTLIEGYDDYDRLLQGYVKTSLLKEVSPNQEIGLIIDKLTQKIYIFKEGQYLSSLNISTGLINKDQPYNETASGEYLISSWTGDFLSGTDMLCRKAIRFNGGDLLHMVPALVRADGGYDYSPFEPKLGSRASHGCVRIQRNKNSDGYNMDWLWDNLKKGSKVIVWDDDGRERPYPDDYLNVFYNENGGKYYHSTARCGSVRDKYLPLTGFYYGQLRDDEFKKLTPCAHCQPPVREETIDALNKESLSEEKFADLMTTRKAIHDHFDPDSVPAQILESEIQLEEPTENIHNNNGVQEAVQYSKIHEDDTEIELNIGN